MRKWEIGRYTITQIVNALDTSDRSDPHAGQMPLGSLADLEEMFEV